MSMREYAVEQYGFILKENEFLDLLKNNNIDISLYDDEFDIAETFGFEFWSCLTGDILNMNLCIKDNLNEENVFIISFKKDNLYEKYENIDEIIEEIKNTLAENGLKCAETDIKDYLGFLSAMYWG